MPRKFFVGGNWKMNGSRELLKTIINTTLSKLPSNDKVEVVIAPPYPYLPLLIEEIENSNLKSVKAAAQNVHEKLSGAFTGEVSISFLSELGVEWVILGHSERRNIFGETDKLVGTKLKTILDFNSSTKVIICIGESLEDREANMTETVIKNQLSLLLDASGGGGGGDPTIWANRIVIAYEPVWAIGTGKVASPQQAQDAHRAIRDWIATNVGVFAAENTRIIYGGSVSASNCKDLAKLPDVDGFLVGGASLKPEFRDIVMSQS